MIVYIKTQVNELSEIITKVVREKENAHKTQYPSNVNASISTNFPTHCLI